MSIFSGPQEHEANPPSSWTVRKIGRKWGLFLADYDNPADTFKTKTDAEAAKCSGFLFDLYEREKRWYAGGHVAGWKTYRAAQEGR